ncbi:MAG: hypothetical protein SPL80_00200 [Bacilli bacterium]|nr:hypothetical protein [Bacilli bacterium]
MPTPKKKLYERYMSRVKPLLSSPLHGEIADAIYKGKTKVLRLSRYESSAFDTSWVDTIEDVLYDLGEIIKAPRTVTKELGSLTPVELAKKTTSESVQHLASHTQYVKTIDEEGNVIPSKIMSFSNDDFLYTYENRFIATFIRRLVLFVEKRYEFIQNYIPLHKEEVLMVKTKTVIDGAEVEIETRIKSKAECDDPAAKSAEEIAERIRKMREYILYYYSSPFMKKMKNERDVRKPILMTNIIRKNVRYHKCYEVFTFIERYESLGLNYKSEDTYSSLNDEQLQDLSLLNLGQFLALQDDVEYDTVKTRPHSYKPRILTSIDDEEFLFGPLPKGPIEFVRVDEEYRKYLAAKSGIELPEHPKKAEKEFYEDEYAMRKDACEEEREIDKLMRRKQAAIKRFEKDLEAIIALREYEDNLLLQWEFQERLDTEEMLLNQKRSAIAADALGYHPEEASLDELLSRARTEIEGGDGARDYYLNPDEEEMRILSEDPYLRQRIEEEAERLINEGYVPSPLAENEKESSEENLEGSEEELASEEQIEAQNEESEEIAAEPASIGEEASSMEGVSTAQEGQEIPAESTSIEGETAEGKASEAAQGDAFMPADEGMASLEAVKGTLSPEASASTEAAEGVVWAEGAATQDAESLASSGELSPIEGEEGESTYVLSRVEGSTEGEITAKPTEETPVYAPAEEGQEGLPQEEVGPLVPVILPEEGVAEGEEGLAGDKKPFIVVKGTGGSRDYSPVYDRPVEELVLEEMLAAKPFIETKHKATSTKEPFIVIKGAGKKDEPEEPGIPVELIVMEEMLGNKGAEAALMAEQKAKGIPQKRVETPAEEATVSSSEEAPIEKAKDVPLTEEDLSDIVESMLQEKAIAPKIESESQVKEAAEAKPVVEENAEEAFAYEEPEAVTEQESSVNEEPETVLEPEPSIEEEPETELVAEEEPTEPLLNEEESALEDDLNEGTDDLKQEEYPAEKFPEPTVIVEAPSDEPAEQAAEEPAEELPVEEPQDETPSVEAEEPFESQEEPVTEAHEELIQETEPEEIAEEAMEEVAPEAVEESPVLEEPTPESVQEEPAEPQEETPIEESVDETPVEEPLTEETKEEEPVHEEEPIEEAEIYVENEEEPAEIPAEPAQIEEEPPHEEADIYIEEAPEEPTREEPVHYQMMSNDRFYNPGAGLASIPGAFVVKTPEGYYVSEGVFSKNKERAKIFTDFNQANNAKKRFGGKVVKL